DLLPADVPILALTATAKQEVERDIQDQLAFRDQRVFKQSFARDNLAYVVLQEANKSSKLLDIIQKVQGSGIVYVRNRRRTKEVAIFLQRKGISADYYHAGLTATARSAKQEAWMNNEIRLMVSTNAFGMGIDKSDVRTVVHLDLPDSLEAYFQEAGRAGRDGQKSFAVLLYDVSDKIRLKKSYEQTFPKMEVVRRVYRALGSHFQLAIGGGLGTCFDFDIVNFSKKYQLEIFTTFNALKILEQAACIHLSDAIFVPSKIQIKVSKEQLYDYQMRHPKFDRILKTIFRIYQGAFHGYVKIREQQLAEKLKLNRSHLTAALQKMQQDQIMDYLPQKDTPQITFLHERLDAENLAIDHKLRRFLKDRHWKRIQKAIAYAEKNQCRSQFLLEYFEEKNAPLCGKCDVCLERQKTKVSNKEYTNYKDKIKQLLQKEQLNIRTLVDCFTPKRRNQVLKVVEFLKNEGIIE
ncbi:MAG: helicase-related protein, partial [Bacteroidota bacterium]